MAPDGSMPGWAAAGAVVAMAEKTVIVNAANNFRTNAERNRRASRRGLERVAIQQLRIG
jgi:hypothetical protein